jgi:endonuclease-8
MPEGDTIHAAADRLRRALVPGTVTSVVARGAAAVPAAGTSVASVTARGKHLLVGFDDTSTLHLHLGMDGRWHVGPPGPLPRLRPGPPGSGVVAVVATDRALAVVRDAPVAEVLDPAALRRHPVLRALGPDLCDPDPDLDEVLRRLGSLDPATPVGVALLEQRVAAGIGNVYRSEVLWAEGVAPTAPLAGLDEPARRALYRRAHEQLRANVGRHPRRTVPEGLAVYERGGRRCRRCPGTIAVARIGEQARSVWWCASCQTAT